VNSISLSLSVVYLGMIDACCVHSPALAPVRPTAFVAMIFSPLFPLSSFASSPQLEMLDVEKFSAVELHY
jgi:hypothetical protein